MPKMKTAKGLAKRFKRTKTGKFLRLHSGSRHLKTSKSPKRIRRLRSDAPVAKADYNKIKHSVR